MKASPGRRRPVVLGLGATLLIAALITGGYVSAGDGGGDVVARQAEVKTRGASVMPFDLDRTRHVFTDVPDGGEQTVTALVPGDATQIPLIRAHLEEEAVRFRAGDFADPAAIHGDDMPGLAELRDGAARITVTYTPVDDGARLRYSTTDPLLVQGIHSWFKAQSTDHSGGSTG